MTREFAPALQPDFFGQLAATDPYQGRARRLFERGRVIAVNGNQADLLVGYDARGNALELQQVPIVSGYAPGVGDWVAVQYEAGHSGAPWVTGPSMAADESQDPAGIGVFSVSSTEPPDPHTSTVYFDESQGTWRGWDGTRWVNFAGAGAQLHNQLPDLQGGTAGQYFHLTAAQHTALTASQPFAATRVLFAGADGAIAHDAGLTYASDTDTLTVGAEINLGGGDYQGIYFTGAIGTPQISHVIWPLTADGADNHRLYLGGGQGYTTRGAVVVLHGNEYLDNQRGLLRLESGIPGTSGTYDAFITFRTNGLLAGHFNRSQQLILSDGAEAAPSFSFMNETGLGFYRPSSGVVQLTGNLRFKLNAAASVQGVLFHQSYTTPGAYSIHSINEGAKFPIRIALASDATTHRYFQVGYYTGDVSTGAWNAALELDGYTGDLKIKGHLRIPTGKRVYLGDADNASMYWDGSYLWIGVP